MAEMIWNAAVSVYNFIMDNIVLINIFLALVIVFFQRRSPQTVWTWLLLLYVFDHRTGFPQEQDV